MLVTVIIKREIREGNEKEFYHYLKELRFNAMDQDGYISGETFIGADDTKKVTVISKWQSLDSWNNWQNNEKRNQIDSRLGQYQKNETIYEPYVFSKYKAAAAQNFPPPLQGKYL